MLDDNLRVLGRRVNDLELELTEKTERIANLEKDRRDLQERLNVIYKEQEGVRQGLEHDLVGRIEEKDREIRKMKEEI